MNLKIIFIAGFVSFIILNFIENLLHYSLGRTHEKKYKITLPTWNDFIKIIAIMILFAFFQGLLSSFIINYENN